MLHADLTEKIIGCAFEVQNELGAGFLESVYEKAMLVALADAGVSVRAQAPINVTFRGVSVGTFYADLPVGGRVIVELKTVSQLSEQRRAQVINYLNATGVPVGLLINFGNPKLQYRRLTANQNRTRTQQNTTLQGSKIILSIRCILFIPVKFLL